MWSQHHHSTPSRYKVPRHPPSCSGRQTTCGASGIFFGFLIFIVFIDHV